MLCPPAFMVYRVLQVKGNSASEPCKHRVPGATEGPPGVSAQCQAREHSRTNVLNLLNAWPKPCRGLYIFFFFCIEIYRSPLHHVPCLLSLWVWGRLERCRCGSAPRAPAKPAQEQAAAPRAPHILLLLCNYGYGKLASVILSPHLSLL